MNQDHHHHHHRTSLKDRSGGFFFLDTTNTNQDKYVKAVTKPLGFPDSLHFNI